ncbi:hypothetical protein Aperf_G00000058744 [Anoplocephala perfoliata]
MDMFASLLEMGFSKESIEFAQSEGYTTLSEIVDFLCQSSSDRPSVLRLRSRRNLTPVLPAPQIPIPLSSTDESFDKHEKNEADGNVVSNSPSRKRSFEEQQQEARKLATKLRKMKLEEIAERERIKRQIEEDKAERALRAQMRGMSAENKPTSSAIGGTSGNVSRLISIRVTLPSDWPPTSRPTIAEFDRSTSTQQDLENFVQSLIDGISTETHEHLTLDLPCIRLSTVDIPRRQLNKASSRTSLLSDLGIDQNTRVILVHSPTECSQAQIPETVPILGSLSPSTPESFLNFLSSPLQPSTQTTTDPSQIPPSYHPPGPSGAAALFRALLPRRSKPELSKSTKMCPVPSLRRLCFNAVVRNIETVTKSGVRFDIHDILDNPLCKGISIFLRQLASGKLALPECLGVSILDKLKKNYAINAASLKLLKNFVCDLDLSYGIVTMEMVAQLVLKWPALTKLNLTSIRNSLQPEGLENLGELRNLRFLSIKGQESVNANVVRAIATLPNLNFLKITNSRSSEGSWEDLLSHCLSSNTSASPLKYLSVDGFGFTDSSLRAVVQLFSHLQGLDIKNTEVTGCVPLNDQIPPLREIRSIKASRKLIELPRFLVPDVTSSEFGLEQIDVRDCRQLNVSLFMDRIMGQPLRYLYGLTNLGSVTLDHVLRLSDMGLQLEQVDLTNVNLWKGVSMSLLSQVIEKFISENLLRLYLPHINLQDGDGTSIEEFMESLLKARSLKEIDFGKQGEKLSIKQLSVLARGLPSLERVIVSNLTADQEIALKNFLPRHCRLRVINEADFVSATNNDFIADF